MHSHDVRVLPGSSRGLRALQGYLHYAETGLLEQSAVSGREPDSDFEVEVADALRERGFEVCAQVGFAGYFLDLAVKHPTKPDTFILGIECDGATYHSSNSARDRDRLRQSVLEGLQWQIHRLWSTDWFKQDSLEIDRIVARIQRILEQEAVDHSAADDLPDELETENDDGTDLGIDQGQTDGWVPEAESQPFSVEDARQELLKLRDQIAANYPDVPMSRTLLRDELLTILLRSQPASREDWLRSVPVEMRLETDGDQVQACMSQVLAITSRLRV